MQQIEKILALGFETQVDKERLQGRQEVYDTLREFIDTPPPGFKVQYHPDQVGLRSHQKIRMLRAKIDAHASGDSQHFPIDKKRMPTEIFLHPDRDKDFPGGIFIYSGIQAIGNSSTSLKLMSALHHSGHIIKRDVLYKRTNKTNPPDKSIFEIVAEAIKNTRIYPAR